MNRKEALLTEMKTSVENLLKAARAVKGFESTPVTGTWTAREVLSHMAAWDLYFRDLSKTLKRGDPLPEWPDFNEFNEKAVSERRDESRDQLVEEVRKTRDTYIQFIQELPEDEVFNKGVRKFSIGSLAKDIIDHDKHHLKQLKAH